MLCVRASQRLRMVWMLGAIMWMLGLTSFLLSSGSGNIFAITPSTLSLAATTARCRPPPLSVSTQRTCEPPEESKEFVLIVLCRALTIYGYDGHNQDQTLLPNN
eukprot:7564429-Pyramimonas_sp.AAC.1